MGNDPAFRLLWLAIAVLASTITALVAGLISWAGNGEAGKAVMIAAATFAGTLTLIMTAIKFVTDRQG